MTLKELIIKWHKGRDENALKDFADKLGTDIGNVSHWAKGRRVASDAWRVKMSKVFGVSVSEVDAALKETKAQFEAQNNLGSVSKSLAAEVVPMPYGSLQTIPFFGPICAGGTNFTFDAVPESYLPLYMPAPKGKRLGSWQVKGDCMDDGSADAIHANDIIICVEQDYAESGKIVVAMLDGKITLKKLLHFNDRIELKPSNPNHKPIVVTSDNFKIIGVVIGTFRRL